MYLMEGSKLLDANVLDGRQDIAKPIVTIIFVPWIFLVFCFFLLLFYTYLELFLSQKRQPIWQKERDGGYEQNYFYILDIYHSLIINLFVYILVHKKQRKSKTKLLHSLKWSRTEAVRKIIQLLHIKLQRHIKMQQ